MGGDRRPTGKLIAFILMVVIIAALAAGCWMLIALAQRTGG